MRSQSQPRKQFSEDLAAVLSEDGQPGLLYPASFLKFLLVKEGITEEAFSLKVSQSDKYFANLFNTGQNRGTHPLPRPLARKLEAMTGVHEEFWRLRQFEFDQIASIHIDMKADISHLQASPRTSLDHATRPETPRGRG